MAPHSSTLAWKIPWMEDPGMLQSMGLLRVRHDLATEQQVVVNSFFNAGILLVTKLGLSWQVFSLTILKLLL